MVREEAIVSILLYVESGLREHRPCFPRQILARGAQAIHGCRLGVEKSWLGARCMAREKKEYGNWCTLQYRQTSRATHGRAGQKRRWDMVQSHPSVGVILYHRTLDALVLVRQFRPAVGADECAVGVLGLRVLLRPHLFWPRVAWTNLGSGVSVKDERLGVVLKRGPYVWLPNKVQYPIVHFI
jgi:hypothetical protein